MTEIAAIQRELLRAIGVGVALTEGPDFIVCLSNQRLIDWFGECEGRPLAEVLPDFDAESALAELSEEGQSTREISIKVRRRQIILELTMRPSPATNSHLVLVECHNVSRIRELEAMLTSYSNMVERHTNELKREKERVDKLLLNILPKSVYEEFKTFGVTTPQRYPSASILMLDFVGFSHKAVSQDPTNLVAELNDIFTGFDRVAERYGIERLKTIGDAYMAVAGVPEPMPEPELAITRLALLLVRYLERRNEGREDPWLGRVGIASGPVVGSVVGVQKYVYDVFGPPVNLAARLEARAQPMEVLAAGNIVSVIKNDFELTDLGVQEVRGFEPHQIFSVKSG